MPATRPAAVRPVSSTTRMRRSRSGRQVRTITSPRRATARQSMDRTSSPSTYSRSESNSVPGPRSSDRCCPSSWRSWASFSPRWRRLRNGGSTRTDQVTAWRRCRAASPSGPNERTMTIADVLSPRRSGVSVLVTEPCPPGRDAQRGPAGHGVRARRPGRPDHGPQRPPAGVAHRDRDGRRLAEQHPGVAGPGDPQPPHAGRQHQVRDDGRGQQQRSPPAAQPRYGTPVPAARRSAQPVPSARSAPWPGYRGTGTDASTASSTPSGVAPSSSASGRSWTRCRRVGRASAFTSSGVT